MEQQRESFCPEDLLRTSCFAIGKSPWVVEALWHFFLFLSSSFFLLPFIRFFYFHVFHVFLFVCYFVCLFVCVYVSFLQEFQIFNYSLNVKKIGSISKYKVFLLFYFHLDRTIFHDQLSLIIMRITSLKSLDRSKLS